MRLLSLAICGLALGGCQIMAPTEPSEASLIRALPVTTLDDALRDFKNVCVNGNSPSAEAPYIFKETKLPSGNTRCEMRARAADNVSAPLFAKFGRAQRTGGATTIFEGYPYGRLLFAPGFSNGIDRGTYLLGLEK